MTLESIEKLRRCAGFVPAYSSTSEALRREYDEPTDYYALEAACGEIEREVTRRYMELPVDADGVPIRPGDLIEFGDDRERLRATHIGRTEHGEPTIAYRRPNGTFDCSCIGPECRHVEPDTWERIVADAVCYGYVSNGGSEGDDEDVRVLAARYKALAGEGGAR